MVIECDEYINFFSIIMIIFLTYENDKLRIRPTISWECAYCK